MMRPTFVAVSSGDLTVECLQTCEPCQLYCPRRRGAAAAIPCSVHRPQHQNNNIGISTRGARCNILPERLLHPDF